MKSTLIFLVVVVTVLVAGLSWLWWGLGIQQFYQGGVATAFANDLAAFVSTHNGSLPDDWVQFEAWQVERNGKAKWTAVATSKHVQLLSPPYERLHNNIPLCVRVINPSMKKTEYLINRRIYLEREVLRVKTPKARPPPQ
jgi:hypothetical protein